MLYLLILFLFFVSLEAHIGFVYPAARYPPLDYLETTKTISPCGMPKGRNPYYTSFAVGRPYALTWTANHDFHKGGIRINLLDPNENQLQQIFPTQANLWMSYPDRVPVNITLTFRQACRGCVLQIERQALDIDSTFHSCADINIEQALPNTNQIQCSGNGRLSQIGCICNKFFTGDRCQYRTDCEDNSDCLNGQCVEDTRPGLVQKSCFCDFSFFGKNCEIQSRIQNLNDMCFNYKNLIDRSSSMFKAYGIFNPDCYDRIDLNHEDFIYSRIIANELEIILDYNTTGWAAIGWRPLNTDLRCRLFPSIGLPQGRSFRQADFTQNGFFQSALEASLHPMDCTDIMVASVVEGRSRLQDMYTRDRSTPLPDSFLQGQISFSAAFGFERDGRTIVMFRRQIQSNEQSDHSLGPGRLHGIWAKSKEISDELRWHGPSRFSLFDRIWDYKSTFTANRGAKIFEFVQR